MVKDVKFTKVKNVKSPVRGTSKAAGIDFFVPYDFTSTLLEPGDSILIPAGLHVLLPEGYALVANNKSGVALKKGLIYGASVIDEDYQGEVHLHLLNVSNRTTLIEPGEKILQFLLEKQEYSTVTEVGSVQELYADANSDRGNGGFGSTGVS